MHETLLHTLANAYGLTAEDLHPLTGGHSASQVYGVTLNGQPAVLRILPPQPDNSPPALASILAWQDYLAAQGAPVARPLRSATGQLLEFCNLPNGTYTLMATTKAHGVLAETLPLAEWTPPRLYRLGQGVGQLHALARRYSPPEPALRRAPWDESSNCFYQPPLTHPAQARINAERARVLAHVQALPRNPDSYGMAHLDLHFANFFIDLTDDTITFFDFDDCGYGWYLMDTALLLFDSLVLYEGDDRATFAEHFLQAYLSGYVTAAPLAPFWIAQLPYFLKLAEISIYCMVAPIYDPQNDDPWLTRFMPGRQEWIEAGVPYVDLDWATLAHHWE